MQAATDGYERRIGRYGGELRRRPDQRGRRRPGQRVLDVGCGSGALTERLAATVGADNVVAVDQSPAAVVACRTRVPGVDVRPGFAEELPFDDAFFDTVLAQLVFGFVSDSLGAAREMRRVTRPGGAVATCVWDFADGMTVLRAYWDAARSIDAATAAAHDQAVTHKNATPEQLERLWNEAGLREVGTGALTAGTDYADFDDLWQPLTIPDGAPGRFYETLDGDQRQRLRIELYDTLGRPTGSFRLTARAWYVVGRR